MFSWTENARNNEDSDINIFDRSVLILLDIINGDFRVNFDAINIRSGGDGNEGNDFGQDMSQENSSNDMMNDAVQDAYHNDGPGPRKGNPTVTNNSNYPIHILDEHNHNIYVLQPNQVHTGDFDGVAIPHLYRDKVLKIVDNVSLIVTNKGYTTEAKNRLDSTLQYWRGGLKGESWLKSFAPDVIFTPLGPIFTGGSDYSLTHWGALFNVLGISVDNGFQ